MKWLCLFYSVLFLLTQPAIAQQVTADTLIKAPNADMPIDSAKLADSLRHKKIKQTIIHSAVIPGWGQINNKQAWKLPFVYAAVGIPVYTFFFNLGEYRVLRDAYRNRLDNDPSNDNEIPERLQPLSNNSIKFYRDEYRKNVDYSALIFIIAWGLNVADAAVFAHLRDFDVSDELAMRVQPNINWNGQGGVSLVFSLKKPPAKTYSFLSP